MFKLFENFETEFSKLIEIFRIPYKFRNLNIQLIYNINDNSIIIKHTNLFSFNEEKIDNLINDYFEIKKKSVKKGKIKIIKYEIY
jgi:hypothetical protein